MSQFYTWEDSARCGDAYAYSPCITCHGTTAVVVVYPASTVPHDAMVYGGTGYRRSSGRLAGTSAQNYIETETLLLTAGSVLPVLSCADPASSGSVAGGPSVIYTDTQTRLAVHVNFPGLEKGDPYVGAAPQAVDSGYNELPTLDRVLTFDQAARQLLTPIEHAGLLNVNISGLRVSARRLVVQHGPVTTQVHDMFNQQSRMLEVQAGDAVYVDIGNSIGLLTDQTRGTQARITCRPVVRLPRQYHLCVLETFGSGTIAQLGFTGLTDRTDYVLFGTLPWDGEQPFPNPDNIVTVQAGTSAEYALIRTRAVGDYVSYLPGTATWYAGQTLNGSLTFRFYTSREDQGAHGEMDVWLQNGTGHFPPYFQVDPYRTLELCGGLIRVAAAPGDTSRNALRVAQNGTEFYWPREFVAADGERIVVQTTSGTVVYQGKNYVLAGTDPGISQNILFPGQVVSSEKLWVTTQGDAWVATDGAYWNLKF